MAELTDWILAAFTVVLAAATIALAWHTARLVKITKQVSDASESLKIMPSLTFNAVQPPADGANKFVRFSVKNVGLVPAKYSYVKAKRKTTNEELKVMQHSLGNAIEANNLFYWDICGAETGDEIEIEVEYTDLRNKPYLFKDSFSVS